jgi:hypothetical protein
MQDLFELNLYLFEPSNCIVNNRISSIVRWISLRAVKSAWLLHWRAEDWLSAVFVRLPILHVVPQYDALANHPIGYSLGFCSLGVGVDG